MQTYAEVAQAKELKGIMAKIYIAYILKRWTDEQIIQCQTGYASEWADRFLGGYEFEASDNIGQTVLQSLCSLYPNGGEYEHRYC